MGSSRRYNRGQLTTSVLILSVLRVNTHRLGLQALTPFITKPLPSLAQALTSYGLSKTHLASLSNPLCGIIAPSTRRTLLVALPGSKGGVKDGMAVLVSRSEPGREWTATLISTRTRVLILDSPPQARSQRIGKRTLL